MHTIRHILIPFALVAALGSPPFIEAQVTALHPFGTDDWAGLRRASAAAVSPDGTTILYRVAFGGAKGPDTLEWRLLGADGSNSRVLELPNHFTPAGFTRDGAALYGRYQVNGVDQLATFALAGLSARATPSTLILLPSGVHSAVPSPNGTKYAVLASPDPSDPLADVHGVVEAPRTSLYVVNTDGSGGAWWCPSLTNIADDVGAPAAGGSPAIAWSRDGASLAVISQTPKIGFHYLRSFIDVCSASGVRRVAEIPNAAIGIAWADEDRTLVFLSTTTSVLTVDHVWTVPASGGQPVDRTPALDGTAMRLAGDAKGNIWVLVERGVQPDIDRYRDGRLTRVFRWPDGAVQGLPVSSPYAGAADRFAFTVADPKHAPNVAVARESALRKITTESDDLLARIDLGQVQVVKWTSKEGIPLEGIATFPGGYQAGRKYPFLVLPHGGPEGNDLLLLDSFSRIIAGFGYVVLQPQYRGSTGYGTDFLESIYQHFGDRAYRDVDSATDFAIAQGWADPERLAIFGWSAGGFMTSWTITQTGRYRAAIEGAGITDWASFIWTSDVQQIDYDATWPEKDIAQYHRFSAVMQADKVTTPLLVLHGEADQRVPLYQGREYFEALAARGKTTRMVTYPGSGHFPARWDQRRDVFREIAAWLEKYNSAATGASPSR